MEIKAVIFDMDGTLISSPLDFQQIRRELDIPEGAGILEVLSGRGIEAKGRGENILRRHEKEGANKAELMPGALEVIEVLKNKGLKIGLLTRNTQESIAIMLTKFPQLKFDAIHSRDNGPPKPDPESVWSICRTLGVMPQECLCVGDYIFDVQAANGAGARSVLFAPEEIPAFSGEAYCVISALNDVLSLA